MVSIPGVEFSIFGNILYINAHTLKISNYLYLMHAQYLVQPVHSKYLSTSSLMTYLLTILN